MKVGIDIDGVLADFNAAYIQRVIDVTGHDLFPPRPFDILTWNYPESYGYTGAEIKAVWASIMLDANFWYNLAEYETTSEDIKALISLMVSGNDVYFVTARPGIVAKMQTELWLRNIISALTLAPVTATVLITSHKGLAARTLELDAYIDDRWENAIDVAAIIEHGNPIGISKTRTFLLSRTWNTEYDVRSYGITRVSSVEDMLRRLVPENVSTLDSAPIATA